MMNVTVVGAGTMGNGIAHVFAMKGFSVTLVDISASALDKALETIQRNLDRMLKKQIISDEEKTQTLQRIQTTTLLEEGVKSAQLVVEAATENFDIKARIFETIDRHAPSQAILATNTSSISITKIAAVTKRPQQVIGMHFMNPVPVMKLVEIINGWRTEASVTERIVSITKELGKTPVVVNDYPGFVANRILMPMINEAVYALYEGVAGVEEIDTVMKLGMNHPMGPLHLADFIGLDVCLAILNVLHEGLGNPKYAPCPLLIKMVDAGHLGVKTGRGFYDYSEGIKHPRVAPEFRR